MYKFVKGQKLLIMLNHDEVIEADYISGSETRLTIINWKYSSTDPPNGTKIHIYTSEIVNIRAFDIESPSEQGKNETVPTPPVASNIIKIPEEKYNELKELCKNYIYMPVTDANYHAATDHLLNSETTAVAMLSTDYGRGAPLEVFVAATWSQIYLFDIALFTCKRFPVKLKYMLESEDIEKVVHDSRGLVDCMFHHYGVKVNNIFDTHVAGETITGKQLTLPQCLAHFFNIPEVFTRYALSAEVKPKWRERPLSDDLKEMAAKHVQFLITLKNCMQKELLKEFHAKVLKHSQSTVELTPLDALMSLGCLDINK